MKKWTLLTSVLVSGFLLDSVFASVAVKPFRERARCASIVIEGIIQTQKDIEFDRQDLQDYRKKNILRVTRIYKGAMDEGSNITIYSHMNFACDTSSILAENRRYLLMLEPYQSDYADANYGRGIWEIMPDHTGKLVVLSFTGAKPITYSQFVDHVNWAIKEPPQWPEEPAISYDKAKKIALEELSKVNISLEGLEYKEHDPSLIKLRSDTIGKFYKDDPVWIFRWIKPEALDVSPKPKGAYVGCYVHAHTGVFHYKKPYERSDVDDIKLVWLQKRHQARKRASEFMDTEYSPKHYAPPYFNNKLSIITEDGRTKLRYYIPKETIYLGQADKYPFKLGDIYVEYDVDSENWTLLWPKENAKMENQK